MDQFAIAMGKKDNAIFLDTATLEMQKSPIHLENAKIVIHAVIKREAWEIPSTMSAAVSVRLHWQSFSR